MLRVRMSCVLAMFTWWVVPALSAEARREIAFPDVPGRLTLKCDFHMHTVFSDGLVWPTVRVEEAWREGLDAIALTDHIEYQPHRQDIPKNHNRPFEIARDLAERLNILLLRGAEITRDTPPGHFNAIFLNDIDPLDVPDFDEAFRQANLQKAFVFWNHPGWKGWEVGRWGEAQTRLYERKWLHGIEVCNRETFYEEALPWALERGLTVVGNSDLHGPSSDLPWTAQEHRTLTLVFAGERSVEGLREALFAGRTAVWCGNRLIGREEHLAPLFEACVQVKPPHRRLREDLWNCEIRNRSELDLVLERVGPGRPGSFTLPARSTSLVQLTLPAGDEPLIEVRVTNLITGPGRVLTAKLRVPVPATVPAGR